MSQKSWKIAHVISYWHYYIYYQIKKIKLHGYKISCWLEVFVHEYYFTHNFTKGNLHFKVKILSHRDFLEQIELGLCFVTFGENMHEKNYFFFIFNDEKWYAKKVNIIISNVTISFIFITTCFYQHLGCLDFLVRNTVLLNFCWSFGYFCMKFVYIFMK